MSGGRIAEMICSRREMICGSGALMATSLLPAFAGDFAVFSKRGRYERMCINVVTVDAGATKPFSVLHISDTHLTDAYPDEDEWKQQLKVRRTVTFGGLQEEALKESIAWAKSRCDYLVHTGDLIDWVSRKNLDLVKKYLGAKMFGSIGNHEESHYMGMDKKKGFNPSRSATRAMLGKCYPFDISFSSQTINGVNFICMDDVNGTVTREQVLKFKTEVERGYPIVLCMHVPFYTANIWRATCKFWDYAKGPVSRDVPAPLHDYAVQCRDSVTREFIAYLEKEPLLKAILAGHEHIAVQERFSPTAVQYLVGGNYAFHGQEVIFL